MICGTTSAREARPHLVAQRPAGPGTKRSCEEAQQRAAGHVADAGRLQHDHARAALRVAQVDLAHGVGDEAVLGAAPRHHGGQPDAVRQRAPVPAEGKRLEQQGVAAPAHSSSASAGGGAVVFVAIGAHLVLDADVHQAALELVEAAAVGRRAVAEGLEDLLQPGDPPYQVPDGVERQRGAAGLRLLEGAAARRTRPASPRGGRTGCRPNPPARSGAGSRGRAPARPRCPRPASPGAAGPRPRATAPGPRPPRPPPPPLPRTDPRCVPCV